MGAFSLAGEEWSSWLDGPLASAAGEIQSRSLEEAPEFSALSDVHPWACDAFANLDVISTIYSEHVVGEHVSSARFRPFESIECGERAVNSMRRMLAPCCGADRGQAALCSAWKEGA